MDAVDVLGRHDRVGQDAQRDVPRQRLLDDDPGHLASLLSASIVAAVRRRSSMRGSSTTRLGMPTARHERRICCTYTLDATWLPTMTAPEPGLKP